MEAEVSSDDAAFSWEIAERFEIESSSFLQRSNTAEASDWTVENMVRVSLMELVKVSMDSEVSWPCCICPSTVTCRRARVSMAAPVSLPRVAMISWMESADCSDSVESF